MKNKGKSFVASCYVFSHIFSQGLTLVSVVIFTRLMNTHDYGIYNTYVSWIPIVMLLIGFSSGSFLKVVYFDEKDNPKDVISGIAGLGVFVSCIYLVVVFGISCCVQMGDLKYVLILGIVNAFFCFITDLAAKVYMLEFSYKKGTVLQIFINFVPMMISITLLYWIKEKQYYARIFGNILGYMIIVIPLLYSFFSFSNKIVNFKIWKSAIVYSSPLILHGIANNILAQSDRTMITRYAAASDTGVYSVAYSFSVILLGVTSSIENIWIPWFTQKMKKREYTVINEMANTYVWCGAGLTCIMMLCIPDIILFFSGEDFWGAIEYTVPLILATFFVFLYTLIVDLEYLLKETKIIALNTVVAGMVNVILNYIFIPMCGAIAAAYTTLASYFLSFLFHYIFARKKEEKLFPIKCFLSPIIFIVCVGVIAYIHLYNTEVRWGMAAIIVLCGSWQIVKNKEVIQRLLV